MDEFKQIKIHADNGEVINVPHADAISLVVFNTFGPAPVFRDTDFKGTVLYVNPHNIVSMEVTR